MTTTELELENKHLRGMVSLYASYIDEHRQQGRIAFKALLSIAYEDIAPWTMKQHARNALTAMYPPENKKENL